MTENTLQAVLRPFFEDLHRHPELGMQEKRTTEQVGKALAAAGIPYDASGLEAGLIAEIRGGQPGGVVGLRCDMDALPITEESGLPYASVCPGRMHACGHDFHTAAILGAALLLNERRAALRGTVKIVFQPAEEIDGGALHVLSTGRLKDVQAFFAIHTYPGFPAGKVGIKEGPVMAAVDRFQITLHGKGGHAAHPDQCFDPIPAAAETVLALQTLISRRREPFQPGVLTVARVTAGNTWNVIPEKAELEGTVRTLDEALRRTMREEIPRMAEHIAALHGCSAETEWEAGSPAVVNDASLCALARRVAEKRGLEIGRQEDSMGAEDFAEYLQHAPGAFLRVGTGGEWPAHHPRFTVDPEALAPAAGFIAELAETWLAENADHPGEGR